MHAADYAADVIAFLIVVFVIYRYIWKGGLNLSGAMAARQDAIAAEIEDSRATRERLVGAEERYRESIAGARAESARIRSEAAAEGEAILAELQAKAEEEYRRMSALNEARLVAERQSVTSALRSEVGQQALQLTEQLLGRALQDPARQHRVVDRFIAELNSRDLATGDGNPGAPAPAGGPAAPQPAGRAR